MNEILKNNWIQFRSNESEIEKHLININHKARSVEWINSLHNKINYYLQHIFDFCNDINELIEQKQIGVTEALRFVKDIENKDLHNLTKYKHVLNESYKRIRIDDHFSNKEEVLNLLSNEILILQLNINKKYYDNQTLTYKISHTYNLSLAHSSSRFFEKLEFEPQSRKDIPEVPDEFDPVSINSFINHKENKI